LRIVILEKIKHVNLKFTSVSLSLIKIFVFVRYFYFPSASKRLEE